MSPQFPKVSIVTINYNGAQYLEACILSVISQEYPNLEYIIIDGGSSDQSIKIIKKYQKFITYWVSEPDNGMYHALQKGFDKSTGEIMAWLNSDDLYHPKSLFIIAEFFSQNNEIDWVMGCPTGFDSQGRSFQGSGDIYPAWSKFRYYNYDYKWIQQESTFWRRSLWEKAGSIFNLQLRYAGDGELWLRFFRHALLYCIPYFIGGFRVTGQDQQSAKYYIEYIQELELSIHKELQQLPLSIRLKSKINWLDRILIRIPLLKQFYYKTAFRKWLGYPQRFVFDSRAQNLVKV
jgi:glycosyltransferase involved in cell wall biosynthesis